MENTNPARSRSRRSAPTLRRLSRRRHSRRRRKAHVTSESSNLRREGQDQRPSHANSQLDTGRIKIRRDSRPESIEIVRSLRDQYVRMALLLASLLLGMYRLYLNFTAGVPLRTELAQVSLMTLPLHWFALIPLLLLLTILHARWNVRYLLAPDYVLEVRGKWGLKLKSHRIRYLHIQGVHVEQDLLQRLLGVGDIRLSSATYKEESEIVLEGIPDPHRYKNIINRRVREALKHFSYVPQEGFGPVLTTESPYTRTR